MPELSLAPEMLSTFTGSEIGLKNANIYFTAVMTFVSLTFVLYSIVCWSLDPEDVSQTAQQVNDP